MAQDNRFRLRIRPTTILWTEIAILAGLGIAAYRASNTFGALSGASSAEFYKTAVFVVVTTFHLAYLALRKQWKPFHIKGYLGCTLALIVLLLMVLYLPKPTKAVILSESLAGDFQRLVLAIGVSGLQLAAQVFGQAGSTGGREHDGASTTPLST